MKRFIFLFLLAGAFLSSCTKRDDKGVATHEEMIFFPQSTFDDVASPNSRAISGGVGDKGTTFNLSDFAVFCATHETAPFASFATNFNWMYKAKVEKKDGDIWAWDNKVGFSMEFWNPNAFHSFFALAPYSAIDNGFEPSVQDSKGDIAFDHTIPTNNLKGGIDLMYASSLNVRGHKMPKATEGDHTIDFPSKGTLPLKFHHALAQLSFFFKLDPDMNALMTTDPPYTVTIKEIKFSSIASQGRMTLHEHGNIEWSLKDTTDITWNLSEENITWNSYNSDAKQGIPTKDEHIGLLIPQSFESSSAMLEVTTDYNGTVKTKRIMLNGISHLIDGSDTYPSVKAGKNYRFTIELMDDDKIEFEFDVNHEVEEWISKEDAYLPL